MAIAIGHFGLAMMFGQILSESAAVRAKKWSTYKRMTEIAAAATPSGKVRTAAMRRDSP